MHGLLLALSLSSLSDPHPAEILSKLADGRISVPGSASFLSSRDVSEKRVSVETVLHTYHEWREVKELIIILSWVRNNWRGKDCTYSFGGRPQSCAALPVVAYVLPANIKQ